MANVSFEEERTYAARPAVSVTSEGLSGLMKKLGLAKTDKEAEYILLGLAVVAVVTAIIVAIMAFGGGSTPAEMPPVPPGTRLPNP